MIEKIYRFFAEIPFIRFIMSIISFVIRLFNVRTIPTEYLTNVEGFKQMDIVDFKKKRKEGISGILRTKNGGKFLEKVVESCISGLDELIIINNLSDDNTEHISFNLIKKYGNKIKYFKYSYEIIRESNKKTNSINSFAYYSNWSISKSSFKTILKLDDDNFFITKIFSKQILKVRKTNKLNKMIYYYYWGLNFYKKNNEIGVVSNNPYSGKYGDIGFFNISSKTYFIQEGVSEKLITNYFHCNLGFSYIHLKYLKDEKGLKYAPIYLKKYFTELLMKTKIQKVEKYTNAISNTKCINIIKDITSNNC